MALGITKDKVQISVEIDGKEVKNTISDLNKSYRQLNREIQNLTPGTEKFNKKAAELAKVRRYLADARDAAKGFNSNLSPLKKGIKAVGGSIKTAFGALAPLLAVGTLIDFGRQIADVRNESRALREDISLLTDVSGAGLDQLTAKSQALADSFGQGTDSINAAAGALSKEFSAGFGDALDELEQGLLIVGDAGADELLNQLDEYATQYADAGVSLSQSIALTAKQIRDQTFKDSGADGIKEFRLRLEQEGKAVQTQLSALLGDEAAQGIFKGIKDGTVTTADALSQVGGKIREIKDLGGNTTPIIGALFGPAGENAGERFIVSLENANESLSSLVDTGNFYVQQKKEQISLEERANLEVARFASNTQNADGIVQRVILTLKEGFFKSLNDIIETIQYFPDYFNAATSSVGAFANGAIRVFNKLLANLGPVTLVFEKLTGQKFQIPEFELENDPFAAVEQKINAERAAYNERQKQAEQQAALEQANEAEKARRLATLQARQETQRRLAEQQAAADQREADERAKVIANAEKALAELRISAMEDGLAKELAAIDLSTTSRLDALTGSDNQIAEQRKLIEQQAQEQRAAIRKKFQAKEQQEAQNQTKQAFEAEKAALEAKQRSQAQAATEEAIQRLEQGENMAMIEAELAATILALDEEFLEARLDLRKKYELDTSDLEEAQAQKRLEKLKERKAKEKEIVSESEAEARAIVQGSAEALIEIGNLASSIYENRASREIAALEERRDAELAAAGDNAEARANIEAKFAKRQEKIEADLAKKKRGIAIGEAVIRGALAIQRIAADVPKVDFGISTALLIGAQVATTAAQIATIRSAKFADGGFTGPGFGDADETGYKPAGIVHEGEYVIPKWQVQSPRFAPMVGMLESARQRGYAEGGAVGPSTEAQGAVNQAGNIRSAVANALKEAMPSIQYVSVLTEKEVDNITDVQAKISTRRGRRSL